MANKKIEEYLHDLEGAEISKQNSKTLTLNENTDKNA